MTCDLLTLEVFLYSTQKVFHVLDTTNLIYGSIIALCGVHDCSVLPPLGTVLQKIATSTSCNGKINKTCLTRNGENDLIITKW